MKKWIVAFVLIILVIIFIIFLINNNQPYFYYYDNVDNAYGPEIGSPKQAVILDVIASSYTVYSNGNVQVKSGEEKNLKLDKENLRQFKEAVKELKIMLENDQKEYANSKQMQYQVRLIKINNNEYRVVSIETSKKISEILNIIKNN